MSNTEIWDAVSKTDPKYTKRVNQRGGFTAIGANYQVKRATEQFGPVGIGWGYDALPPLFTPENMIIVPVTLWHGDRSNVFGPEYGCAELVNDKGRRDNDAPKKATTDAITKLLSRLGFSADVFLGLFDDDKYVAEMEREFTPPPETITPDMGNDIRETLKDYGVDEAEFLKVGGYNAIQDIPLSQFDKAVGWIESQKKENN